MFDARAVLILSDAAVHVDMAEVFTASLGFRRSGQANLILEAHEACRATSHRGELLMQ